MSKVTALEIEAPTKKSYWKDVGHVVAFLLYSFLLWQLAYTHGQQVGLKTNEYAMRSCITMSGVNR